MVTFLITTSSLTVCNIILRKLKKEKVSKKAIAMFNEHGIDVKNINKIFCYFFGKDDKEALDNAVSSFGEVMGQFYPIVNLYYVINNILYLKDKKSCFDYYDNYFTWEYYDRNINGNNPLKQFDELNIIDYKDDEEKDIPTIKLRKEQDITIPTINVKRNTQKLVLEMNKELK